MSKRLARMIRRYMRKQRRQKFRKSNAKLYIDGRFVCDLFGVEIEFDIGEA
jgi:hypothetical protein